MRAREFDKAIETLKSYENKEPHLMAHAATNLSFIYFHEGDYAQASSSPRHLPRDLPRELYGPPAGPTEPCITNRPRRRR